MEELKTFICNHNFAVRLISGTNITAKCHRNIPKFTEKCHMSLPKYTTHHTNHPAGTARGGTVKIIRNYIKHNQLNCYFQDFLQATGVSVEDSVGLIIISTVYPPP
jgi:hypothetical protein